ncbi:MAG: DUF4012 domain-containing protein [Chloroflexi bacterium]|nr:DUF4012 domain-containing protein [Chloroflexota bacterium]
MATTDIEKSVSAETLQPEKLHKRRRRRSSQFKITRRVQKRLRKFRWRVIVITFVVVVLVAIAGSAVLVVDSLSRVQTSQTSLNRLLDSLNTKPANEWTYTDFERLQGAITELLNSLESAEQRAFLARPFARFNDDLAGVMDMLDAAQELGTATNAMLTGLQPTLFYLTEGQQDDSLAVQGSSGERAVELLTLGRGSFATANQHLTSADNILNSLNSGGFSADLLLVEQDLLAYYDQLLEINQILLESPELLSVALGLNDTQSYLVLAQNSDEIRPSGGYISTYGWMTVRNARVVNYDYSPTTETSPNPPPASMASELDIPSWWIQYGQPIYEAWDASWYADFPATAKMAAWYYDNGNNPQSPVDGVIAIDMVGFEYLVEALGSVVVPEYNEVVTAEDFRDVIYRIRAEGEGSLPHKQFLVALYKQIINDWQKAPAEKKDDLLGAQLRALREKHIMLYFGDESLNNAVEILNWAGQVDAGTENDYLLVADANVGANKSGRSIHRQITYDVEIKSDGTLNSRVTIAYDYSAAVAELDPAVRPEHYRDIDYYNTLQVITPAGSTLVDSSDMLNIVHTVNQLENTTFVTLTKIPYDTAERLQFSYSTPALVEIFGSYRRYRLHIQKQPGIVNDLVSVQVRLPVAAKIIDTSIEPSASFTLEQPILEFRTDLSRDQWIEIIFQEH